MGYILLIFMTFQVVIQSLFGITVYDRNVNNTTVGGYMDTEWLSNDDVNTFKAHRLIIQYGARLTPAIRFNSEIEYEYAGFVTNKNSEDTNQKGELKIEQAWLDHDLSDAFTLRTGIILVPVGQLNIYHDSDLRDFTARPLVNYYIIPTTWMDTGIGGYGQVELGDIELTYEGYLINGLDHTNSYSSSKGTRGMRPNFKNDTNRGKAVAARLGVIPSINSEFGLSTYQGQSSQSMVAFDGRFNRGAFGLKGEAAVYTDGYNNDANGYNIESKFNVAPFIGISHPINALARYESIDLLGNESSAGALTKTSFGVNIRPVPSLVYKLEYAIVNAQGDDDDKHSIMASVAVGF